MRLVSTFRLVGGPIALMLSCITFAGELSDDHKKELTVFGLRSMGLQAGVGDVKTLLAKHEIDQMVATGINLNGHLCAQITDIRALKLKSVYEARCITMRGGSAETVYILDALKGTASAM